MSAADDATSNPYRKAECPRCGALVLNEDKHEEWHQELNDSIGRAATAMPGRIR